jgi:class 3 adenylate cyclase/predicted ATPase
MSQRLANSSPLDGERKNITALFADIRGSTELTAALDPEDARAIIDPVLRLMIETVRGYDGYVVHSTGDGIFAVFGAPIAHEDHPQRALNAALAMQMVIKEFAASSDADRRTPIEARIGVSTGEVVVRTIMTGEYAPIGHTTNLASRLQTFAPAGSIAISEETRKLVEGYFEINPLGEFAIKGLDHKVNVFEVSGIGALRSHFQRAVRRGLTKFVGREHEITHLQGALQQAGAGHGQVVAVAGEAGAGKSRLIYEFIAQVAPTFKIIEAYSASNRRVSTRPPVMELLHVLCGIDTDDSPAVRRDKIRREVMALDKCLATSLTYLYALSGASAASDQIVEIDGQTRRSRILEAITKIILTQSLKQPIVVVVEDLHWIDQESQALLNLLADNIPNARIVLLVSYRTEYQHQWSGSRYFGELRLGGLGVESTEAMLAAIIGSAAELAPAKQLVIDKASGNPFFIEEIVQVLFDERILVRDPNVRLAGSLSLVQIPPTVRGILAARIDRLSVAQKSMLQTLAVIGREFPLQLALRVAQAIGVAADLPALLKALSESSFIYESAGPEPGYVFKHALTQQVAYGSLLLTQRARLHETIGNTIEALFVDRLSDHYVELGHHFRLARNTLKAIHYLRLAGQRAVECSAYKQAFVFLKQGLELLDELPEGRERAIEDAKLRLALYVPIAASSGMAAPELEKLASTGQGLIAEREDPRIDFSARIESWALSFVRGELATAHQSSDHLLRSAQKMGQQALMQANFASGITAFYRGDFLSAQERLVAATTLYDPIKHRSPAYSYLEDRGVAAFANLALVYWHLGYPAEAVAAGAKAIEMAREFDHAYSAIYAFCHGAVLAQYLGDVGRTLELADQAIAGSTEHSFAMWLGVGQALRGWALAAHGDFKRGVPLVTAGIEAFAATGTRAFLSYFAGLSADALLRAGQPEEAFSRLTEAMSHIDRTGEKFNEAELYRLVAAAILNQASPARAEALWWLGAGLDIARKQSAKSDELRLLTNLVSLSQETRRAGARRELREVCDWFGASFETEDLAAAKHLLLKVR